MIRRPFCIQLDGEGDQDHILADLGSQFLFQSGDGRRQIFSAGQVGVIVHMSMSSNFLFGYGLDQLVGGICNDLGGIHTGLRILAVDVECPVWLTGDNEANIPPMGESGVQMRDRVLEALADIKENTCIITHGGVIAAIMENLFPNEGKNRYQWQPQNGRGYCIQNRSYQML